MSLLLLFLPDQQTHATLEIEAELNGAGQGWTDISADVQLAPPITVDYGINGGGPLDLVAGAGTMTFALNNGPGNSANLLGYYSPEHANCRSGFALDIGIRVSYALASGRWYKFTGRLDSITPISGTYGERKTLCSVVDWMDEAARLELNVATQVSKRADEILTTLVAEAAHQPSSTDFDTGDSTFTYALDSDRSEADPLLTVLQRLCVSEYGRSYLVGNNSAGGELRLESRSARYLPTSVATFTDTMVSIEATQDRSRLLSRVKATAHPRTVDGAATTVLFTNQGTPSVAAGETIEITGYYSDANDRTIRVGGTDMVTPVATTDYTMNTQADGLGTNLTASFTVTADYGANSVIYTITNASGSLGYITLLQARGRGLYDYNPVDATASNSDSTTYGTLTVDLPYQSDLTTASEVASRVMSIYGHPQTNEVVIRYAPPTVTDTRAAIIIEPGDAITVTETATGVDAIYFVQHVSVSFEAGFWLPTFAWTAQLHVPTPVIRTQSNSATVANTTTHTLTLPSGIEVDDLIISVLTVDGTPTITWPGGWTEFATGDTPNDLGFNFARISLAWHLVDGTEGATIDVTTSASEMSTNIMLRIVSAADPTIQPPEASSAATGTGLYPDQPSITPTGGPKQFLFVAACGLSGGSFPLLVGVPAGYSQSTNRQPAGGGSTGTLTAGRTTYVSSEDPGIWTLGLANDWVAFTVAVHPAEV